MRCSNCAHTWLQRAPEARPRDDAKQDPPQSQSPPRAAPPAEPTTEPASPSPSPSPSANDMPPQTPDESASTDDAMRTDADDTDIPVAPPSPRQALEEENDDGFEIESEAHDEDEEEDDAGPPEPEPIPASLAAARAAPVQAPGDPRTWPSRGVVISASVVALLIVLFSPAVIARDGVLALFPGAQGVYEMIGLSTPIGAGLRIEDVRSSREPGNDTFTLVVEGVVTNTAEAPRPIPDLRVSLIDVEDGEVQFVAVSPDKSALVAGESLPFAARFEQPAASARRIRVTFTAPKQTSSSPSFAERNETAH